VAQLDNQGDPQKANVVAERRLRADTESVPVSPRKNPQYWAGILVGLALVWRRPSFVRCSTTRCGRRRCSGRSRRPLLGVIAADRGSRKSPLIVDNHARSVRAEAFRQLRTNLQFIDAARPVGVLLLTSSIANEGKVHHRDQPGGVVSPIRAPVLLIEADLRRPRVAEYWGWKVRRADQRPRRPAAIDMSCSPGAAVV